jgi:hypothetical protein
MSFGVFIYYCGVMAGWGAFLAWAVAHWWGADGPGMGPYLKAAVVGGLLGAFVAAAVGLIEALLNDKGMARLARMAASGGLGIFAGAAGSLVGTAMYRLTGLPAFVGLPLGWMLAGALIGASAGVYDLAVADPASARRKITNGVIGGVVGGMVGGLPFAFLANSPALPRSGLAIGLVLLGAAIGLAIGLAQVILKEAWIKVVEGFRPGRELLLTKPETTIGRAESCDLGLFGDNTIERLHARILLTNGRYHLAHASEEGQTLLNGVAVKGKAVPLKSGDEIGIGKSVLSFGERQKRS